MNKSKSFEKFRDKTIIISGSSKGIGKVLARELGLMGANIVLNGTNEEVLAATNKEFQLLGINTLAVAGDVSDINECNKIAALALDKFDRIDIVIANAGMSAEGTIEESDPVVFKKLMEINYLGAVYLVKACLPALKTSRGNILLTGSVSGFRGMPGYAAYSATKMALTGFAEALKVELKTSGIYVGIAYVGFTQNDEGKQMFDKNGNLIRVKKIATANVASQQTVARKMIAMIEGRQHKKAFSALGKITDVIVRFAPALGNMILERNYLKKTVSKKKMK